MNFSIFTDQLFPSNKIICLGKREEDVSTEAFFRNKKRSEITRLSLELDYKYPHYACLSFMTPDAFAYFLPVYMRLAVEDIKLETDFAWTVVSSHLLPMAKGMMTENRESILNSYTKEQLNLIPKFLLAMKSYFPNDNEIDSLSYWKKFL